MRAVIVNQDNKEKKLFNYFVHDFLQDRVMYKNYRPGSGQSQKHPEG